MNVRVWYVEYCGMHPLYVVPGDDLSLLGSNRLQSIRLKSLLQKYGHIFCKRVGTMKHFEVR